MTYVCPDVKCGVGLCNTCFSGFKEGNISYIDSMEDENIESSEVCGNENDSNSVDSYSTEHSNQRSYESSDVWDDGSLSVMSDVKETLFNEERYKDDGDCRRG